MAYLVESCGVDKTLLRASQPACEELSEEEQGDMMKSFLSKATWNKCDKQP